MTTLEKKDNKYHQLSTASFTRLMADYKSVVYEKYVLKTNSLADTIDTPSVSSILVVEDNIDQWFLTRWALLQRFPQFQIQWLANDSDVVPYLDACLQQKESLPHVILVDLYLPSVQQGLNVLQVLKSHPVYRPIPIITLSWYNSVEDMVQAFNHLADGYMTKPTIYQDWLNALNLLDKYLIREL